MIDETELVKPLHDVFCAVSGRETALLMSYVCAWRCFMSNGWTADDLRLVIPMLKDKIKAGKKWDSCLNVRSLIAEENFAEYLAEAKAIKASQRAHKPTPSDRMAIKTGHAVKPRPDNTRTAAQILAASKAVEEMRKFRESL